MGSAAIMEKLERFGDVSYAIVLLTADDKGVKRQVGKQSPVPARMSYLSLDIS
jgi:predicted nucleotide-binding protein